MLLSHREAAGHAKKYRPKALDSFFLRLKVPLALFQG
jgi:hypothetical protein